MDNSIIIKKEIIMVEKFTFTFICRASRDTKLYNIRKSYNC